ncbi:MAG TPA: G1 family glutamic endopeptidase [Solirubrobacteraceae bacterium]|nr:G1 family glutamic endopeptidase [Solirubrobacteraceae bacterium]
MLLAASLAGCGAQHPIVPDGHQLLFGKFAGYSEYGRTRAIAADWWVPSISRSSGTGVAGTWIGEQADGLVQTATPFIQVGVNEIRAYVPQVGRIVTAYYAFWSDTALQFHPRPLFAVQPGDRISASMAQHDGHWSVAIADLTSHVSRRFTTAQDANASFSVAEWAQEDLTDAHNQKPLQYPERATFALPA